MRAFINEVVFFMVASAIILPTPILIFAYMTNKTFLDILYR